MSAASRCGVKMTTEIEKVSPGMRVSQPRLEKMAHT